MAKKAQSTVTQVAKYEILYLNGYGDFQSAQKILWEVQKQVRLAKNYTVQTAHEFQMRSLRHKAETGSYLDAKAEFGCSLENACYRELNGKTDILYSGIKATASRAAFTSYTNRFDEMLHGQRTIDYYKGDQPIPVRKKDFAIGMDAGRYIFSTNVISDSYWKSLELPKDQKGLIFKIYVRDNARKEILDRVISGEYGKAESQIIYRKDRDKKKKWFLLLSYCPPVEKVELDKNRILGVDLGITEPAVASVLGGRPYFIRGAEADEKEKRKRGVDYAYEMEKKKADLQRQANFCGDGRIGHGRNTRMEPLEKVKSKIANYQDTLNHTYSKRIVEYAVKCGCGIIQMEDLSKIEETAKDGKRLKHWTYFDLQTKIENKAKAYGIVVKKVNPQYTSQRCSNCGCIAEENRPKHPTQAVFKCIKCGFSRHADYNASQNLATKNIDKIIEKALKAST